MINRLAWDSRCFGYEVGMIAVEDGLDWQQFIEESSAYQLVYIFSKKELCSLPLSIQKVDEKITLQTSLDSFNGTFKIDQNVLTGQIIGLDSLNNDVLNAHRGNFQREFLDLALMSGEYSRFRSDDRLVTGEYEKLYYTWAERGLKGNDDGFVFLRDNKINGLITLASNGNGRFKVGLLAVLSDCREQGVGSLLTDLVCGRARERAGGELQVTTQKANKKAHNFYLNRGFTLYNEQNVYHWWKG